MKIAPIGTFAATVVSLLAVSNGYSFSEVSSAEPEQKRTELTRNTENRIYGGTAANIDEYPYLASLRDALFDETFCAGTLIHPQFILTAAHCIRHMDFDVVATFGTNESTGDTSTQTVSVPVMTGFRHPMYRKKEHLFDVGLFKLEKPIDRPIAKLCNADGSDNEVGTFGTVLGWGKTETSGEAGNSFLKELRLPIVSNAECGKFEKYIGRVTEGMLCAGTGNGKDTCNGDSGGPLFVDGNILVGCVSWGSTCGQQPGIFTRLTYVMDYIKDILAGGDGSKFYVESSLSGSVSGSMEQSPGLSDDDPDALDDSQVDKIDLSGLRKERGKESKDTTLRSSDSTDQSSPILNSDADVASSSDGTIPVKSGLAFFNDVPEDTDDPASKDTTMNNEDSTVFGEFPSEKTAGTPIADLPVDDINWLVADTVKGGDAIEDKDSTKARKALLIMALTTDIHHDPTPEFLGVEDGKSNENNEPSKRKALQIMAQMTDATRIPSSNMDDSIYQMDTAEQLSDY